MVQASADEFLNAIEQNGLVEPEALQSIMRIDPDHPPETSAEVIAKLLVQRELLTDWQCRQVQAGRASALRLGKYVLLKELGRGGMGVVFLARHSTLGNRVAIKALPSRQIGRGNALKRFLREARVAAQLNHPNITRTYDVDREGNTHYLVMELIDGKSLEQMVRERGPLPVREAVEMIRQAAEGLTHAHAANLVHRDIKPSNLMLDSHKVVKILDFGLARIEDDEDGSLTADMGSRALGTADFLAPEQALDSHHVDGRADIYSLGYTLYFLLVGKLPFPGGNRIEKILRHCQSKPRDIREFRQDVPVELLAIFRKMTRRVRDKRYATVEQVRDDLTDWLAGRLNSVAPIAVDPMTSSGLTESVGSNSGSGEMAGFDADMLSPATSDDEGYHPTASGKSSELSDPLWEAVLASETSAAGIGATPAARSHGLPESPSSRSQAKSPLANASPVSPSMSPVRSPLSQPPRAAAAPAKAVEPARKGLRRYLPNYRLGEYPLWLCITAGVIMSFTAIAVGVSWYRHVMHSPMEFRQSEYGDGVQMRTRDGVQNYAGRREADE